MSFRQKMAALSLVATLVMYGWYFAVVLRAGTAMPVGRSLGMLRMTVVGVIVIQIIGAIVVAIVSREGQQPMDERERLIEARSRQWAYALLLIGALAAAASIHFNPTPMQMTNAILAAVVIAEIARFAGFLILHHRQP